MIPMNRALHLRSLQWRRGFRREWFHLKDHFYCPGYKLVDDRRIHCANRRGHGSQNFVEGAQNSCNPVFIEVGLQRWACEKYYKYFRQFGLMEKTGIDLPGEAGTIMHKMENMGNVEACYSIFRTVFSDYAGSACCNGKLFDQWRKQGYTSFRSGRSERRRKFR